MTSFFKNFFSYIKFIANQWRTNANGREAAAISFYAIFSIVPVLVIGVFVLAWILGEAAGARELIVNMTEVFISPEIAQTVKWLLDIPVNIQKGFTASAISLFFLLYASSKVITELQFTLNKIYGVDLKKKKVSQFILSRIYIKLISFALVLSFGIFLFLSIFLSALLAALAGLVQEVLPAGINIIDKIHFPISVIIITLLMSIFLKVIPARRIPWRYLLIGPITSAVLFTLLKQLFGTFLGTIGIGSAYGAAGSVVVLLIWIYFSIQVFLLGAEISNAQMVLGKKQS